MAERTNSEKFLTAYNELDRFMRVSLNEDFGTPNIHLVKKMAEKNKVFERYSYDLRAYADLRNAIVHNPDARVADPIAEPHDYILKKYQDIVDTVTHPPLALTIAIKAKDIYTTSMEAKALKVMDVMSKNSFSHVPVVQDHKLIGVFSENTVFSYLVNSQAVDVRGNTQIREFQDYIPLSRHENEYYEFVPRTTLVIDIEAMFQKGLKDKKRLAVVFITENGRKEEHILGLITAWDLAKI